MINGWTPEEVERLARAFPEDVNIYRDEHGSVTEAVPKVTKDEFLARAAAYPSMHSDAVLKPSGDAELDVLAARYPTHFKRG